MSGLGGDGGSAADAEPICGSCADDNPHFAAGEQWLVAGALTFDTAASVFNSSRETALPKTGIVDLARVDAVDSAALAVLLAWQRRAAVEGVSLGFVGAPPNLAALAELYGVQELISQATPIAA